MRLLVACPACERRFDATGRSPGSRFRCHCGEVVVVQRVDGHEAAVVRCSGCAAPRAPGAVNCVHCGAAFEAGEVARNTICSSCMTRCADGARFCHGCGTALASESVTGDATDLPCPVCGDGVRLEHHQLGDGPPVLECPGCAGLWLEHAKVEALAKAAREREVPAAPGVARSGYQRQVTQQAGPLYRPCPCCASTMNRRNYGRASGIVIDVCKEHGTWFDADELPQILAWIEAGGLKKTAALDADEARRRKRAEADRAARAAAAQGGMLADGGYRERGGFGGGFGGGYRNRGDGTDLLEAAISIIGSLFHR